MHLARLRCGHNLAFLSYESRLCPEVDLACRWCEEGQETISRIFQECPQLAVERADAGVSNPRDLWDAPAVALRFAGPLGTSLDSIRRSQGKPTPRYKGVRLRADALAASALQEGAGGAKQQQQLRIILFSKLNEVLPMTYTREHNTPSWTKHTHSVIIILAMI